MADTLTLGINATINKSVGTRILKLNLLDDETTIEFTSYTVGEVMVPPSTTVQFQSTEYETFILKSKDGTNFNLTLGDPTVNTAMELSMFVYRGPAVMLHLENISVEDNLEVIYVAGSSAE